MCAGDSDDEDWRWDRIGECKQQREVNKLSLWWRGPRTVRNHISDAGLPERGASTTQATGTVFSRWNYLRAKGKSSASIWEDTIETVKKKLRVSEEEKLRREAYSNGFQVKHIYDKNNLKELDRMGVFMESWRGVGSARALKSDWTQMVKFLPRGFQARTAPLEAQADIGVDLWW